MSELWERQPDESNNWYGRFLLYRDLEVPRTLLGAVHKEEAQKGAKRRSKSVPGAWFRNSELWRWKARAEAYDAAERKRVEAQKQAYIDGILEEGFALKHERVKQLGQIADKLIGYLDDEANVWLPDVKAISTGPVDERVIERVDIIRFNAPLISEIRASLADIAAEMGDRVKRTDVRVKELPKIYLDLDPDEDGVDR